MEDSESLAAAVAFSAVLAEATLTSSLLRQAMQNAQPGRNRTYAAATLFAVQASMLGGLAGLSSSDIAEGLAEAARILSDKGDKKEPAESKADSKKDLPNWEG